MDSPAGAPLAARQTLRSQLLRLTLGTLLPLLLFACVAALLLAERERATFERGAQDRVRALATAVDAELRNTIDTLRTLASAGSLEAGDLRGFHARIVRQLQGEPDWYTISLALPSGEQAVNALRPYGEPLPLVPDTSSFAELLRDRQPVVGRMVFEPIVQRLDFPVRVPVLRDGAVQYVLSAIVKPATIKRLLDEQRFPAGWSGLVLDGDNRIVARSLGHEASLGKPAAEPLGNALAGASEGWLRGSTIEGAPVYTAFFRSAASGWSVAMNIPLGAVEGAGEQAMWILLAGAAAAVLLAFAAAWWFGRRIAEPIGALAAQALQLADGAAAAGRPRSAVREIEQLGAAFEQAGAAVRARDATQRQLAAVTGNATLALFMLDEQQQCIFMNPAAEAMSGFTLAELQDRPLHELIHHLHPDGTPYPIEDCPIDRAFPANDRQRGEDMFVHKSGRFYPVAYTASPIREGGRPVGTIIEVRDISEHKRAEAERLLLLDREQRARAEAEAANRAKDEFLAMLGHELRNPLGAISNAAHIVGARPGSEHAGRAQGVIRRQLAHLTRLVDDLLDAGRVSTGKIVLTRSPVQLAELVQRTVSALAATGTTAQHRVALDLDVAWVHGDETRLEQIATNLLSNAARYTPPGGCIAVSLKPADGDAVLTVADDGIGIAPAMLPRIFDLFVQGERSVERAQGGLGIGLTLVRRLVELHGGKVSAASGGTDRGSTFSVRLPRIEPPAAASAVAERDAGDDGARRILIVEDNDDAREMLAHALRTAGHQVSERADGPSGVEAALALLPDVALIDVGLPGLSGYDVARRIRAEPEGRAMLLVALTGYGQPEDRRRSLDAGFDLHAVKPLDAPSLLRLVAGGRPARAAGEIAAPG